MKSSAEDRAVYRSKDDPTERLSLYILQCSYVSNSQVSSHIDQVC